MQQVKSCSPNDAKPSTQIYPQSAKVAISISLGLKQGQLWKPLWTTLRQAEDSYYEPMHCGCKQDCKTRCKCAGANFPCTALCYFGGDCSVDFLTFQINFYHHFITNQLLFSLVLDLMILRNSSLYLTAQVMFINN